VCVYADAVEPSVIDAMQRWVLRCLSHSYICRDYDCAQDWRIMDARLIANQVFDAAYK